MKVGSIRVVDSMRITNIASVGYPFVVNVFSYYSKHRTLSPMEDCYYFIEKKIYMFGFSQWHKSCRSQYLLKNMTSY